MFASTLRVKDPAYTKFQAVIKRHSIFRQAVLLHVVKLPRPLVASSRSAFEDYYSTKPHASSRLWTMTYIGISVSLLSSWSFSSPSCWSEFCDAGTMATFLVDKLYHIWRVRPAGSSWLCSNKFPKTFNWLGILSQLRIHSISWKNNGNLALLLGKELAWSIHPCVRLNNVRAPFVVFAELSRVVWGRRASWCVCRFHRSRHSLRCASFFHKKYHE